MEVYVITLQHYDDPVRVVGVFSDPHKAEEAYDHLSSVDDGVKWTPAFSTQQQ